MQSSSSSPRSRRRAARRSLFCVGAIVIAAVGVSAATALGQSPGTVFINDSFDPPPWPNDVITNEYATYNPNDPAAPVSPVWKLTSGSLFWRSWRGSTGDPQKCPTVDRYSEDCTNSAIFRMLSKRRDFRNVKTIVMQLRIVRFGSADGVDAWDGVHLFLRYQSETSLYYASVARRDGRIVIKKKCPGGSSNGGTYYPLTDEVGGYAVPLGSDIKVAAWVSTLADGRVWLRLYRNNAWVLEAIDNGVGCAPITSAGAIGIRTDDVEADFDNVSAEAV